MKLANILFVSMVMLTLCGLYYVLTWVYFKQYIPSVKLGVILIIYAYTIAIIRRILSPNPEKSRKKGVGKEVKK